MSYIPKKKYETKLMLVIKRKELKKKLNEVCSDFCKISGNKIPLRLTPLGEQVSKLFAALPRCCKVFEKYNSHCCVFLTAVRFLGCELQR